MKSCFKKYLFEKNILVNDKISEHPLEAMLAIAQLFGIEIISGQQYAHEDLIPFISLLMGEDVPAPFYEGFPESVKNLSTDELLFDQILHYVDTYGLGHFSESGHSLFETFGERIAFDEQTDIKQFAILTVPEAEKALTTYVEDLLKGTRPLSDQQYSIVLEYIQTYQYRIEHCACKDTAIRLLLDTRDLQYTGVLHLSDVIKLVDILNYSKYNNKNIKKLNLCNQDRKFITCVIDSLISNGSTNYRECFEKQAIWCGLLHHIHYRAKTPASEHFVSLMRGENNDSVYSEFEHAMEKGDIRHAVTCLLNGKGNSILLRNLNYIISRCKNEDELRFVLDRIESKNAIILIQLLLQYGNYVKSGGRAFKFTRYNQMLVHLETEEEQKRRKSTLSSQQVSMLTSLIRRKLEPLLHGRVGKVYISPEMYSIAVPIQENTSNGGYGVLPKGSRIHLESCKKLRAFTYWEKVNDIDLSVIGIAEDGKQYEFSWRTMFGRQSEEICYSGDQTSGYNGGSEYFDIELELFKKNHPLIKYLVFCNNVYSDLTFDRCVCRAGYMLRDVDDTGEVFEPKTVQSSFTINCNSTFAYLFGIDLETNDFVWLNATPASSSHIAGINSLSFLMQYFNYTSIMNVGVLFEMLATQVVDDPSEADVMVSDYELTAPDQSTIIRSFDVEKIIALMN